MIDEHFLLLFFQFKISCDWLANRKRLFPKKFSIKIGLKEFKERKIKDLPKTREWEKAASWSSNASQAKTSFFEKINLLINKERKHQPNPLTYISQKVKKAITFYIYPSIYLSIYFKSFFLCIVGPKNKNKYLKSWICPQFDYLNIMFIS